MAIDIKKNTKTGIAVLILAAFFIIILRTAGGGLDVIGRGSVNSFEMILQNASDRVTMDEANDSFRLEAPDGSVYFAWGGDYGKNSLYDVMLEFDARPFVEAGLDTGRLPDNYTVNEGKIMTGTKLGGEGTGDIEAFTPLSAYAQIVDGYRSSVNYHASLDHYGVKLGGGNMFEWAKDMDENTVTHEDQDKDIVFVLNPEPLIEAGVSPDKVEGWIYAPVSMEENGKMVEVYKLLKPFDLK